MTGTLTRTLAVFVALAAIAATPAHATRCYAVDGDTLRCGPERIRIIGLDAPEMHGACPLENRAARAARDRLSELLDGERFTLERRGLDRYQRTLAIVRRADGENIADILIREGHARPYSGRGRREGWC
jgi:endonuclease YncB( thermonuclease family)